VYSNHIPIVKCLLFNGSNTKAENNMKKTPLMIAKEYCRYKIVELILESENQE